MMQMQKNNDLLNKNQLGYVFVERLVINSPRLKSAILTPSEMSCQKVSDGFTYH